MKSGFTLIELLVVVLIIGILGSIAGPQYMKTVDTSRIRDGFGTMMTIGAAQEMCWMENTGHKNDCKKEVYSPATVPYLVQKKYMAQQKWAKVGERRPTFGTSLYSTKYCVAGCYGFSGHTDMSACMNYCEPNSFNSHLGYTVLNNVCGEGLSNKSAPKCPH